MAVWLASCMACSSGMTWKMPKSSAAAARSQKGKLGAPSATAAETRSAGRPQRASSGASAAPSGRSHATQLTLTAKAARPTPICSARRHTPGHSCFGEAPVAAKCALRPAESSS